MVRLLGRDIPLLAADDGTLRAEDDGEPASAKSMQSYIARALGDRLAESRGAMEARASSLPSTTCSVSSSSSTGGSGRGRAVRIT